MLKWKIDVVKALSDNGYNQYVIRKNNFLGQSQLVSLRNGQTNISLSTLDKLCKLLNCQPADLLEFVPDTE